MALRTTSRAINPEVQKFAVLRVGNRTGYRHVGLHLELEVNESGRLRFRVTDGLHEFSERVTDGLQIPPSAAAAMLAPRRPSPCKRPRRRGEGRCRSAVRRGAAARVFASSYRCPRLEQTQRVHPG